jgi:hypothetical protein
MTFDALTINATYMRETSADILTTNDYSDAALVSLKYNVAKNQLKHDMRQSLGLGDNTTDNTRLDDVTDKYETDIQNALMYLQLYWFFVEVNDGEGTKNNDRMKQYKGAYEQAKREFASMRLDDYVHSQVVNLIRG